MQACAALRKLLALFGTAAVVLDHQCGIAAACCHAKT
jgi:hypothetical protein